jgi:hypothetical protein
MDDDLSRFCCLNPDCPDHGRRNAGNLTVCARYGKYQRRLLRCRSCKARFSERKGTPLFDTVHKRRKQGRVVAVESRRVFGELPGATGVSTAYLERQHATDRHRNARKARKTYRFSKDWDVHEAVTCFTLYSYNFCWPVRTLRAKDGAGRWRKRTPAMAAGLTDHVWTLSEWLSLPGVQR